MMKRGILSGISLIMIVLVGGWKVDICTGETDRCVKKKINAVASGDNTESLRIKEGALTIITGTITLSQEESDAAKREREENLEKMGYVPPYPIEVPTPPETAAAVERLLEEKRRNLPSVINVKGDKPSQEEINRHLKYLEEIRIIRQQEQGVHEVEYPVAIEDTQPVGER